ncbi:hypothetical protein J4465_01310 [Candidatus Pacearchaeota archaeon]|nr:hypothetical protein [Candidatus Pacearchaeota archaeon]
MGKLKEKIRQYKRLYVKLKSIKPNIEVIEKLSSDGKSKRSALVGYVNFKKRNKRVLQNLEIFKSYIYTINLRSMASWRCLNKLKKDCEIKSFKLPEKKGICEREYPYSIDFLIGVEYFIFSVKSCLDIIAHIVTNLYELNIQKREVNILKIITELKNQERHDNFAKILIGNEKWIADFNKIRVNMTHHSIIRIKSKTEYDVPNKRGIFCKRNIHVKIDEFEIIEKKLPLYFDEISKNKDELIKEFYKWLDGFTITPK